MSKKILGVTLYTMSEVSDLLGVTQKSVSKYIKDGRLTYTLLGGKSYISEDTLKKYLTEGTERKKGE